MSGKQKLPGEIRRLLEAADVSHVDLYAGRMLRNGQGQMVFTSKDAVAASVPAAKNGGATEQARSATGRPTDASSEDDG
jgi:hypothetical protein